MKPLDEQTLVDLIREIMESSKRSNSTVKSNKEEKIKERFDTLTSLEYQVMENLVSGKVNTRIADELNISICKVETYYKYIMQKMNARNFTDLVKMYVTADMFIESY